MQKTIKMLALAVAVLFTFTGCSAFVINEERQAAQIVATVDNLSVTYGEIAPILEYIYYLNGIDATSKAKEMVAAREQITAEYLDQVIKYKAEEIMAKELGLFELTQADKDLLAKDAEEARAKKLTELTAQWKDKALLDKTITDPEAKAKAEFDLWVADNAMDDEAYISGRSASYWESKLEDHFTKDVTVSDEEVKAKYDQRLEEEKAKYTDTPLQFATDVEGGTKPIYTPEGFRYVKHVLIPIDSTVMNDLQERRYQAIAGATTAEIEAAQKERDEKLNAEREVELAKIRPQADIALGRVQAGEDFDKVVAELGQDPGVKQEPYLTNGYLMCAQTAFMPEFLKAALELAKPGDTTGLVATDAGYHIIKYESAVVAKTLTFDEMKDEINGTILSEKKTSAFSKAIDDYASKLESEGKIKKNLGVLKS